MSVIYSASTEGYHFEIVRNSPKDIFFKGDFDVDADGGNGQSNAPASYMVGNRGVEDLANGGMYMLNGEVRGSAAWFADIVILESSRKVPKVFPGGIIASKTAYHWMGVALDDPAAYVDSQTIPYVCVPPSVINCTPEIVLGCSCYVFNTLLRQGAWAMVADVGPRNKVGEGSIELARQLGINSNPRTGGEEKPVIEYHIYPGVVPSLTIAGRTVRLLKSNGQYV